MKKKINIININIALSLVIVSISCLVDNPEIQPETGYEYSIPDQTADGWKVGSATSGGLDTEALGEMMNYVNNMNNHNIHNILIFKNDTLVFEEYFEGYLYLMNPPGSNGDYLL